MSGFKHCFGPECKQCLIAPVVLHPENIQAMLSNKDRAARIRRAMDEHQPPIKPSELAVVFGITPQAVSSWLATGRIDKGRLTKLAVITGKPLQFFLDSEFSAQQPLTAYLSDDEQLLLEAYRDAPPAWRLSLRLLASLPADQQARAAEQINALLSSTRRPGDAAR